MPVSLAQSIQPPLSDRAIFVLAAGGADEQALWRAMGEAKIPNAFRFFSSGSELIEDLIGVLRGAPPPLLCLLQCRAEGRECLDVLRWIRLHDALREVSVVVLSRGDPVLVHEALCLGAQCCAGGVPGPAEIQDMCREAVAVSLAASGRSAFDLPCNLMLAPGQAGAPPAVAAG